MSHHGWTTDESLTLETLKERVREVSECCLPSKEYTAIAPDMATKVLLACFQGDDKDDGRIFSATDSERIVIYELDDGRVAIYEEGEDYTGHG